MGALSRTDGTLLPLLSSNFFRYGEGQLAELWKAQWRSEPFCRIEINKGAIVPGGLAADNNPLEATNQAHKRFARSRGPVKLATSGYIPELAK